MMQVEAGREFHSLAPLEANECWDVANLCNDIQDMFEMTVEFIGERVKR